MADENEDTRLGGGWWSDDPAQNGLPPLGTPGDRMPAMIDPVTRQVSWGGPGSGAGRWEPVTYGDPENPQILFHNGDVVMYWVED